MQSMPQSDSSPLTQDARTFSRAVVYDGGRDGFLSLPEFEQRMSESDNVGVVLYENPIPLAAAGFAQHGIDGIAPALASWKHEAEENLRVLRKLRGRCKIVESAKRYDEKASKILTSGFGDKIRLLERDDEMKHMGNLDVSLAELMLLDDFDAVKLLSELKASSSVSTPRMPSISRSIISIASEVDSHKRAEEAKPKAAQKQEEHRAQLVQQIVSLQNSLKISDRARRELKERNRVLEQAEIVLQEVYQSTSWKISAPIRAVKRLLAR